MSFFQQMLAISLTGSLLSVRGATPAGSSDMSDSLHARYGVQCSREVPDARRIVASFVSLPEFARSRRQYGIPTAQPEDVRAVTDSADAPVCEAVLAAVRDARVNHSLAGTHYSIFQVGKLYYVAPWLNRPKSGPIPGTGLVHIETGWTSVYIVDQNFRVVASLAM